MENRRQLELARQRYAQEQLYYQQRLARMQREQWELEQERRRRENECIIL